MMRTAIQWAAAVAVALFAAGGVWAVLVSRVSAAEATIERHERDIRRLDRGLDRSWWNTWAICRHVGALDCERPPEGSAR